MAITAGVVQATVPFNTNRIKTRYKVDRLYSTLALGSSGAISSQTEFKKSGMLFTLTGSEAGRYTVNVWQGYKSVLAVGALIVGPDDNAMTDAKGIISLVRDLDVGGGANDGTFEVQFVQNTDLADDDIQDNATVKIWVDLEVHTPG